MTPEDKQLLLKDLCARLPYGVIVRVHDIEHNDFDSYVDNISNTCVETHPIDELTIPYVFYKLQDIKPYLRPMSSMTEEEENEYRNIDNRSYYCPIDCAHIPASKRIDWFNANHFDYRGLIEKGLAIEVTPDNNPYKT